jgi:hypothetical protein
MADETGQVGCAAPRLLRLLALTTNCHLAQDILSYFTGIAPALPLSLWRFPPLSFKASLHSVLCRVARWWQSPSGLSASLLPWDPPLGYLLRIPLILRVRICRVSSS